jgi:hypothetical protein
MSSVIFYLAVRKRYRRKYLKYEVYPFINKVINSKPSISNIEYLDIILFKAVKFGCLDDDKYLTILNTLNRYFMNKDNLKSEEAFIQAYNDFFNEVKNMIC